jgi:DNA polymerase-3 subunit gamma/tau
MSYVVLARRWRPQTFDDVVGQQHITTTLKNAIKADRLAHAYLFVGPRGIGKTSTARILAKALTCEKGPAPEPCNECPICAEITAGNSLDVIEIDAASSSHVEDVRELRDNVRFAPVKGRFKIYIIDEVHMLSAAAFNALLKTLEEPPAHTKFVLATTEVNKVPATIISRCQRFDFRRISESDILERLKRICVEEHVEFDEDALLAVANSVEGSLRDAESILDQLIAFSDAKVTYNEVESVLGLVDWPVFADLCTALRDGNIVRELEIVDEIASAGKDLAQFARDLMTYFRHLLVSKVTGSHKLVAMPAVEREKLAALAKRFSVSELVALVEKSAAVAPGFRGQFGGRVALEVFLMSATKLGAETSIGSILEKLVALEERLRSESPEPADAPVAEGDAGGSWEKLVAAVTKEKMTIGSFLRQAQPLGIEDNKFVVQFNSDQPLCAKTVKERAARELIETKLEQVFGKKLALDVRPLDEAAVDEAASAAVPEKGSKQDKSRSAPHPPEVHEDVVTAPERNEQPASTPASVQDDEKVKMVLELFNGNIVQVDESTKTR